MANEKTLMSEEARRKRNEYIQKWRRQNPEKVKSYVMKYWEKKAKNSTDSGETEEHVHE